MTWYLNSSWAPWVLRGAVMNKEVLADECTAPERWQQAGLLRLDSRDFNSGRAIGVINRRINA